MMLYIHVESVFNQFKFASCKPFTSCCIGSAGHRTTTTTTSPTLPHPVHSPELAFSMAPGPPALIRSQSFPASFAAGGVGRWGLGRDAPVYTIPAGLQDTEWGSPSSLDGLLATAFICHEALQPAQTRALYMAGKKAHTNTHNTHTQKCSHLYTVAI